jgi:hypothetical protein
MKLKWKDLMKFVINVNVSAVSCFERIGFWSFLGEVVEGYFGKNLAIFSNIIY